MPLIPALERNVKQEAAALSHSLILRFLEAGLPFQTEVELRASSWCFVLFFSPDFQVEPNFCLWVFINHTTCFFVGIM